VIEPPLLPPVAALLELDDAPPDELLDDELLPQAAIAIVAPSTRTAVMADLGRLLTVSSLLRRSLCCRAGIYSPWGRSWAGGILPNQPSTRGHASSNGAIRRVGDLSFRPP
jgi:hypothetical protein